MSPVFKKFTSLLAITTILTSTGFGCKAPTAQEAASVAPVTLNYWTVFDDTTQLRKFAADYQALRPQVTINIRQIRYEEFDKLFTNALADDVGPDIISMHVRNIRKYTNRLSPMPATVKTSFATIEGQYAKETVIHTEEKAMPTLDGLKGSYVNGVYQDAVINGQIYGLPLAFDSMAIYYNKTLLDQSGTPTPPTTWDELVAAIKAANKYNADGKITQSGIAFGTGSNVDNAADILSLLIMQKDYQPIRGSSVVFHQNIDKGNQHPTLTSLRFYTDFAQPEKEVYSWDKDMGNAFDAFIRNKTVFYFGYAYDYTRIKSRNPQMVLETIPIPQLNPDKPVNIANYWLETVTKKAKKKDYAWDFIRFMTLPSNIKKYSEAVKIPSPLREHIGSQKQVPALATFTNQSLTAQNWYRGKEWEAAKSAMQRMIDNYIEVPPDGVNQQEYEKDVILRAGRAVQQTM